MVTIVNKHFDFEGFNISDINNENGFSKIEFYPLNQHDNVFKHLVQIVIILKLNPIFYNLIEYDSDDDFFNTNIIPTLFHSINICSNNNILITFNEKWFKYEKSINPDSTNLFNIGTTILIKIPFDNFIEILSLFPYTNIEVKLNNRICLKNITRDNNVKDFKISNATLKLKYLDKKQPLKIKPSCITYTFYELKKYSDTCYYFDIKKNMMPYIKYCGIMNFFVRLNKYNPESIKYKVGVMDNSNNTNIIKRLNTSKSNLLKIFGNYSYNISINNGLTLSKNDRFFIKFNKPIDVIDVYVGIYYKIA